MVNRLVCVFLLVCNNSLFAHDWGRYWCFGDSAAIDFTNVSNPISTFSFMDSPRSCTSVGDSANGLLMYAHSFYWPLWSVGSERTTVVHNSNHQVMINGDSLFGEFNNTLTFINKPGSDSLFYLFELGIASGSDCGLYYSIVDPYFNGIGKVIQKNIKLNLADSSLMTTVLPIRHGNGRDWWILVRNWNNMNKFNVFLVSPDTILGPLEQNIGTLTDIDVGIIAVSKQGDQIALANSSFVIETYKFDRCTGQIYNPKKINALPLRNNFSCEFSPSGNLLYVANTNYFGGDSLHILQYDLTSPNPANTQFEIYSANDPVSGGLLKRGPDDKIYFSCLELCGWPYQDSCRTPYNENLSVINLPDILGAGCQFSKYSFNLGGKRTYWDLPNNANFTLGEISGSIYDSLTNFINNENLNQTFNVFPNPCNDKLTISIGRNMPLKIQLYDMNNRLVYETENTNSLSTINTSNLTEGIYFLAIPNYRIQKIIIMRD
jgi:hypothetical protein